MWRQGVAAGMWRRVTMVPIIPIPWGAAAAAAGGAAEEACCGTGAAGAAARAAPVFCGLPRGGGARAAGAAPPFFLPKPLARAAPRVSTRGRAVGVAWLAHIVPELLRSHALSRPMCSLFWRSRRRVWPRGGKNGTAFEKRSKYHLTKVRCLYKRVTRKILRVAHPSPEIIGGREGGK